MAPNQGNDEISQLGYERGSNLGIKNVGFLNDWAKFPDFGAFVGEGDLLDLSGNGIADDPGWIFVQKIDFKKKGDENTLGQVTARDGSLSYTFEQVLSFSGCKNKQGQVVACGNDAVSGNWTYSPPPAVPDALKEIIGADKYFDQAAIVFKAAREFVIFNFKLSDILAQIPGGDQVTESLSYGGTWDMTGLLKTKTPNGNNDAGISHATLWLRDPYMTTTDDTPVPVPEPASLALLAVGLLGWGFSQRFSRSRAG